MKTIAFAAAAVSVLAATPALAEAPVRYVQANIGAAVGGQHEMSSARLSHSGIQPYEQIRDAKGDIDDGVIVSLLAGQKINAKWAIEGEIVYAQSDATMDQGFVLTDSTAYGIMANVSYEALRRDKYGVYVGAGIGYGKVENDQAFAQNNGNTSDGDSGFMWQLKAGVTYDLSARTSLDVGYRYLALPETPASLFSDTFETEIHALTAGVRYTF